MSLIDLELNTLQKKLRKSWASKIFGQIFIEYKHLIQWFVDALKGW